METTDRVTLEANRPPTKRKPNGSPNIVLSLDLQRQERADQLLNELLEETNLFDRFAQDVHKNGLVGETDNSKIILLSAVSARLDNPIHLTVVGSTSTGKNFTIKSVLELYPAEYQKFLSGMSAKALMHIKDKYALQHKAIIFAEYEGASGADYAIRTLQSEKIIEYQFTDQTPDGFVTRTNTLYGPVAIIQATTRPLLHPENETRMLFIHTDESQPQTKAIVERQAREAEGIVESGSKDFIKAWHSFFKGLKLTKVRIPFAQRISPHFPTDQPRSRRDFPKLLEMIRVSAYLHQHHREIDGGTVIATPDDYEFIRPLFEHSYSNTPDLVVAELLREAESLSKTQQNFSVADLAKEVGWKKTKTYKVLDRAIENGWLEEEYRGRYKFIVAATCGPVSLPETIE